MFLTRISSSARSLAYCLTVLGVTGIALVLINSNTDSATVAAQSGQGPVVESPAAVFPGTGVGNIPDATACGPTPGTPLNVTFNVTGIPTDPPTSVAVDLTPGIPHTWVGDIICTLIAPNGASHIVFGRTGATTATAVGFGSDLTTGLYSFSNTATTSWWTTASVSPVAAGSFRTSGLGGAGATNPMPATDMNAAFAGIPTSNGTWTLRFTDGCDADTGSIASANLTLTGGVPTPTPPDALADFDGDGKTDYGVIRSAPGISGQATWYVSVNASSAVIVRDWGLASDTYIPGDFDGDGKDDFAVWRPGVQGTFYVIESSTNSIRTRDFGIGGDDVSVVGDYNNDGKDDFAVYRSGTTPGSLSFWFWEYSGTIYSTQWGLNGDFVAPGDYDGDGIMDFAVQRNNGPNSDYYVRYSSGTPSTVTTFGLANDLVVPGDYDGDLRTDLAVVRLVGANWLWVYRKSSNGTVVSDTWGLTASNDYPAPGDYDGDGKADYAIWRSGALSTFYIMTPETHQISTRQWGLIDDVPVTLTYAH